MLGRLAPKVNRLAGEHFSFSKSSGAQFVATESGEGRAMMDHTSPCSFIGSMPGLLTVSIFPYRILGKETKKTRTLQLLCASATGHHMWLSPVRGLEGAGSSRK